MLPVSDQKLLKQILDLGHDLEKSWPDLAKLDSLRALVVSCSEASPDLARLSSQSRLLVDTADLKQLITALVPFERLRGKALRDDEFLVSTTDSQSTRKETPFVVIAENIRSAFNVGAIMRTSEAFGASEVILSGYTPTPDDEKTARTSMGTEAHQRWSTSPRASEAVTSLRAKGYSIVALETSERAVDLDDFDWPEKSALLLGNERFGVDHDTLALADHIVRIPLLGAKNSLNVGIAYGIAINDYQTKRLSHPITPIGTFQASTKNPYEARRQASLDESSEIGVIELAAGHQFEQALRDLDGFERIWLLYRFHENESWKPMTLPPRGPHIKRGVFATRSPYRPNPIGLSCVELVKIEGLKVFVRGFDLLDQSPIYDIKPYIPYADSFANARAGWTDGLPAPFQIEFGKQALSELSWLEENGVRQLRHFIKSQLEFDPLDSERKRVVEGSPHVLSYRTWRAHFEIHENKIEVLSISSGYSEADLHSAADPHGDKEIHRRFKASR